MRRVLVLITCGWLAVAAGCSHRDQSGALQAKVTLALRDEFALRLPAGFTNTAITSSSYATPGEGSFTTVYLVRFETDQTGVQSLLDRVSKIGAVVFRTRSSDNGSDSNYPTWWCPHSYDSCNCFTMSVQNVRKYAAVTVYVPISVANSKHSIVFMHLAVSRR